MRQCCLLIEGVRHEVLRTRKPFSQWMAGAVAGEHLAELPITLCGIFASTPNQTCRYRSRRGVGLGQLVEVRQRLTADLRGLVGGHAEHDQHVAGGAIGRLGIAAFGLVT